jgi:hypothetical protein
MPASGCEFSRSEATADGLFKSCSFQRSSPAGRGRKAVNPFDSGTTKLPGGQLVNRSARLFFWVKSKLPRQPQTVPPIYQPEVAAGSVLYAADHPGAQAWNREVPLHTLEGRNADGQPHHDAGRTDVPAQRSNRAAHRVPRHLRLRQPRPSSRSCSRARSGMRKLSVARRASRRGCCSARPLSTAPRVPITATVSLLAWRHRAR